jgi:hypothetical protein
MRALTGKEWLLVAISLGDPGLPGKNLDRVRLMKTLFVFSKSLPGVVREPYQFEPYNYGPFDVRVYNDVEQLAAEGLVHIQANRYGSFAPTEQGREAAGRLIADAPGIALDYLKRVREWAVSVDFATLVKAIYQQWPEMQAKSQFQG